MARLQRVEFWGGKQFAQFGFLPQGQATGTNPVAPKQLASNLVFRATQQFVQFKSIGQATGTSTPVTTFECQVSGPDVRDLFRVESGLSYTWFPLHRRTK